MSQGWLRQEPCSSATAQQFQVIPVYGYGTHFVEIRTRLDSQCLDVYSATQSNAGWVQKHPCNNGGNQRWVVLPNS